MRGKGVWELSLAQVYGITPAYAGKRKSPQMVFSIPRDHPRLCGEKQYKKHCLEHIKGSPPPMRGKVNQTGTKTLGNRITPAYAGKRFQNRTRPRRNQDHPRLCGEKRFPCIAIDRSQGSPPPMRGKAIDLRMCPMQSRITPAYAGKSGFDLIQFA